MAENSDISHIAGPTPGPWRVERDDDGYVVVGKPAWPCERFGKRGEWDVARIDTSGEDDKLNARLIAAAPELLEACEAVVNHLAIEGSAIQKLIRAAIAKARGQS